MLKARGGGDGVARFAISTSSRQAFFVFKSPKTEKNVNALVLPATWKPAAFRDEWAEVCAPHPAHTRSIPHHRTWLVLQVAATFDVLHDSTEQGRRNDMPEQLALNAKRLREGRGTPGEFNGTDKKNAREWLRNKRARLRAEQAAAAETPTNTTTPQAQPLIESNHDLQECAE